jgi:hypothetical protein
MKAKVVDHCIFGTGYNQLIYKLIQKARFLEAGFLRLVANKN